MSELRTKPVHLPNDLHRMMKRRADKQGKKIYKLAEEYIRPHFTTANGKGKAK